LVLLPGTADAPLGTSCDMMPPNSKFRGEMVWNPPAGCIKASKAPALPDQELMECFQSAGGNECFSELFVRHPRKMFFACRGFFSDGAAAKGATRETILRAFRSGRGFEEGSLFASGARRTAERVWRGTSHLPFELRECLDLMKEFAQGVWNCPRTAVPVNEATNKQLRWRQS
jgi:hypothetical protein